MKVIIITPEDWMKLTEYVEEQQLPFYKAEKAVDIQRIFRSSRTIELTEIKENEV